jgi:hypothetical protein
MSGIFYIDRGLRKRRSRPGGLHAMLAAHGRAQMRRILAAALALAASTPAAAQAPAAADPTDASARDIRCFVAVAFASSLSQDPAMKANMGMGVTYYLGRLKGREPNIDLKARIVAEARRMEAGGPDLLRAEMSRCGRELVDMGRETQDVGSALETLTPKPAS